MFVTVSDKVVNLKNVSNINIVGSRIIFNMNYNINIGHNKFISDYVYWEGTQDDLNARLKILNCNDYFVSNFIEKVNNGYVNINEISSMKLLENKYRVIFNLSHPVSFKDHNGVQRLTSEFVYVDCGHEKEFKEYVKYVKVKLGEK